MSYDPLDEARDAMYEKISDELYPEHKDQAIVEFTTERLRSYYVANPTVMRPAVDALLEAQRLHENGHYAATVLFAASSIEILLKITILKPVFYGLVHIESLADVVVEKIFGKTGYDVKLLERIFTEFVKTDVKTIIRNGATKSLIVECNELRSLRNSVTHSGTFCTLEQATLSIALATAVYEEIVRVMLHNLGLQVVEKGEIQLIANQ